MQEIKAIAHEKIWAKLADVKRIAKDPNIYWKVDPSRQLELNKRDKFEQKVWSYILELIEKDNKL